MAKDFDPLHALKHSIVNTMFIVTADDNYVLARWAFLNDLNVDFLWLAVHCLEKYLKAALLLNGRTAKPYKHDITELYVEARSLAPELLPIDLIQPSGLEFDYWHKETVDEFVGRLYRDGQADNRYQLYGYVRRADDLFKLDQLVFAVRPMCQPLEVHFLGKSRPDVPDTSRRDWMQKNPNAFTNLNSRLEEIMSGKGGVDLTHAALNCNFPFARSGFAHTPIGYVTASQNPVLFRRIYEPLKHGPQHFAETDQLWEWVQDNIYMPKKVIKEIDGDRERLKRKWTGK